MVADPPNAIVAPLTVILELVNAEFGILVRVLVEPEIDLLVKVCDPVSVATVESMAIVTGAEPL